MDNLFSIKNKIAIVTGSESGLGKAIAEGFKKAKAIVYGFDKKKGQDITNISKLLPCINYIYTMHKQVNILVNCAGITISGWNIYDFQETIYTNLFSQFNLIHKIFPIMKEGSSIINITSLASEQGFTDNPGYVASKGGMKALTKALAKDLAKYGIRVNNICPGYFITDMTEKSFKNPQLNEKRKNRTILKRWGEPKEIVGTAIFLASNASSYITGTDIIVDGGWLANGI